MEKQGRNGIINLRGVIAIRRPLVFGLSINEEYNNRDCRP